MASLSSLSDQDLRKKLKAYGITSPVTDSTRSILLKKLNHILASEKSVSSFSKSNKFKPKDNFDNQTEISISRSGSRLSKPTTGNIKRREKIKDYVRTKPSLNNFSSDEDDHDDDEGRPIPVPETRSRRILRNSNHEASPHNITNSVHSLDLVNESRNSSQSSSFIKKQTPIIRKKSYNIWPSSRPSFDLHAKDDVDYQYETGSDSDVGNDDLDSGIHAKSLLEKDAPRSSYGSDLFGQIGSPFDFNSRISPNLRSETSSKNDAKEVEITSPEDVLAQEPVITASSQIANGQNSFESVKKISIDSFPRDSNVWNPSVPLVLLVLLALFFCFLGFCYLSIHTPFLPSFLSSLDFETWKIKLFGDRFQIRKEIIEEKKFATDKFIESPRKFPVCHDNDKKLSCLSLAEAKNVPDMIPLIETIILPALSLQASQHHCGEKLNHYLETEQLLILLKEEIPEKTADDLFEGLMGLGKLVNINLNLGFKSIWSEIVYEDTQFKLVGFASTSRPTEILCHVTAALSSLFYFILALIVFSFSTWVAYHIFSYYKKQSEEAEQKSFELVEQILDVLENRCGTDGKDFIAVNHVRDFLIPPRERKTKTDIWNKAVAFIDNHDSRVYREIRSVAGEDNDVWRWVSGAPRSPISCPPKGPLVSDEGQPPEKIWQGQAFESLESTQNIPSISPTSCLKIRNMFDSELEYGENWPRRIQDSLLEKCEGVKIVHIAVDKVSKEGCVYLKCASPMEAGKAYRSLHGWWFDGNLVTVKYLRDERYHERFPTSRSASATLTPSNNQRLSLQQAKMLPTSQSTSPTAPSTPTLIGGHPKHETRRLPSRSTSINSRDNCS